MKKLIIIGRGRGANLGLKAEGEKWSVNFYKPGTDVLFNIHNHTRPDDHVKALADGQRIILQDDYPLEEILDFFGTRFFSNSICYIIALAIYQGFESIDLYGCNIIPKKTDEPIIKNHPGVEFWLGYAMGRGIDVTVQGEEESFLLRDDGLYGFGG